MEQNEYRRPRGRVGAGTNFADRLKLTNLSTDMYLAPEFSGPLARHFAERVVALPDGVAARFRDRFRAHSGGVFLER